MTKLLGTTAGLVGVAIALLAPISPEHYIQQVLSLFRDKPGYPESDRLRCRPFLPKQLLVDHPPLTDEPQIRAAADELRRYLDGLQAEGGFETIAVAVTTAGGPLLVDTRGTLRANESALEGMVVTPHSQYRIASVAKLFPVFLGWLLQQRGIISWDDPVKKHIQDLPENGEDITLYDLATHMSGLGRDWPVGIVQNWPYDVEGGGAPPYNGHDFPTVEELLRSVGDTPRVSPAWTEPQYSNTGAGLLGLALLEAVRAAGVHHGGAEEPSFARLMREEVFELLGMNGSHFLVDEKTAGHVVVPSFMPEVVDQDFLDAMNPAGGQFSSLHDLVTFAQILLDFSQRDSVITRRSLDRWLKPVVSFEEDNLTELGMMWEIIKHRDSNQRLRRVYWKLGLMLAYGSCFAIHPGSSYGVVVLMTGVFPDAAKICYKAFDIFQPAIDAVTADRATDLYEGKWVSDDGLASATVMLEKGVLYLDRLQFNDTDVLSKFPEQSRLALRPTGRTDEFRIDVGFPGFNGLPHMGCYTYWNGKDDYGHKNGNAINLISFLGEAGKRLMNVSSLNSTLHQ
ncbi:beta-lactamase/transpeptidase-like protein [Pleurostoma richardsiae]|uniref:Beta-lactamase/transpeptidase-like protein n=1 Tax=Pleurostoma richardsiae TaxID=41990 RepID=A0AA38SDC1_9PEZI|nr:beta-lactamase/transpeptidase-like protein [Pleurostoma richardsiae]